MRRGLRIAMYCYAASTIILALGFALQADWATRLWPWTDDRLSYIFIGAVLAALAASFAAWAYTNEPAGGQAIALNSFVVTGAGAVHFLRVYLDNDENAVLTAAIVFAVSAIGYGLIAVWSFRYQFRDRAPLPALARWSFAGLSAVFAVIGVLLVTDAGTIMPWAPTPDSTVLFGWVFLGDALFFLHGVLRPYRANARGLLLNLLAYDLVLILPLLRHFSDVSDDDMLRLGIYTALIGVSGLLAIYFLFMNAQVRLFALASSRARPTPAG